MTPAREPSLSAPLEPFATTSQRAAVPRLEQLYQAGMRNLNLGGIRPRTKPLLVGPSGCGKSAAVRLLAGKLGLETLSVNASSWIVYGAKQDQYTLTGIRDFVHRQWERGGLIFIDEIDKAVPRDGAPLEHWSLSVFTELLAALDGDRRLLTMGWSEEILNIFTSGLFLVVGAGAWQHLNKEAKAPVIGFGEQEQVSYNEMIVANFGIPGEIGLRFCQDFIVIEPPTTEDFERGICLIHEADKLPSPSVKECHQLAQTASDSNYGVRWLENYALKLTMNRANAHGQRTVLPERPPLPVSAETGKALHDFRGLLLTVREQAAKILDRLQARPYQGPDENLRYRLHEAELEPTLTMQARQLEAGIRTWLDGNNALERKRQAEEVFVRWLRETEQHLAELRQHHAASLSAAGLSKPVQKLHDHCYHARLQYDWLIRRP